MTTALRIDVAGGELLVEQARLLLERASTVDEAKEIRDQVVALSVYVRARGAADEDVRLANIARLWAERRIGELTRVLPKATKAEAVSQRKDRRTGDSVSPVATKLAALSDKGITKKQAQRYEKLADIPEEKFTGFAHQRVDTAMRAAKRAEDKGGTHVSKNSGEMEWYTPPGYIEAARRIMGDIDLDPASCAKANETVKAKRFYSVEDDGLARPWFGRVWMNPPYASGVVDAFAAKLVEQRDNLASACVLVNNATETEWFQKLAGAASAVCFPSKRVKYLDRDGKPVNTPLQGQAVLFIGDKQTRAKFINEMSSFGTCWVR